MTIHALFGCTERCLWIKRNECIRTCKGVWPKTGLFTSDFSNAKTEYFDPAVLFMGNERSGSVFHAQLVFVRLVADCVIMLKRQLYRSLMRQSIKIDRNPRIKAFIFTSDATFPRDGYEHVHVEHILNDGTADKAMKQLVQDFCAPGVFYKPEKSLTQLVRKTFREPPADLNDNQLHQLGFSALRQLINCEAIAKELIIYGEIPHELKGNIVVPASGPTSPNAEVSVAEVASTTVETFSGVVTNAPEVGSILVSHPLRTEDTFSSSVTLVTRVTDDHSSGIILNRDFNGTFKARLSKAERVKYGADLKHFYEMPCFSGGSERYHDHPLDFVILHQLDSLAPFSERIHFSSPITTSETAGESSSESVATDYLYISHDFHSIGKEIAAGRVKTGDLKVRYLHLSVSAFLLLF